jgi:hypothetical protein
MAHRTRGRRSGTYEIEQVVKVDLDRLEITYRHAAAYQPQTVRLDVDRTPAAEQMLKAMADSIKTGGNGDEDSAWESSVTLTNGAWNARTILREFYRQGFDTFADPRVDVPILRRRYEPMHSNRKRSACWLLARVIRDYQPDGAAVNRALRNTRFRVEETDPFVYDDGVADAIEAAARGIYAARFKAQRELFRRIGYDAGGRAWLRVPATELVDWVQRTHTSLADPLAAQPSLAAPYEQQVAWALTHPERFGQVKHRHVDRTHGPQMHTIGRTLYPDNVVLTAALILRCLGENIGFRPGGPEKARLTRPAVAERVKPVAVVLDVRSGRQRATSMRR